MNDPRSGYKYLHHQTLLRAMIAIILLPGLLHAQSISNISLRDRFRNMQLVGEQPAKYSVTVNSNQIRVSGLDSALADTVKRITGRLGSASTVGALPLAITQQYNSQLPYEWNIAPMIPAKGYQVVVSAGIYGSVGNHITFQLSPELVYARNPHFEQFSQQLNNRAWADYYRFLNTSDIPSSYGEKPYQKIFAGQSSIRYNFRSFSAGISTENMWWGPGWRNALIMSTNAPGFLHFTFNTTRPVKTGIGSFEGQIIGGKLEESNIPPDRINSIDDNGVFVYQPKRQEWRYITGMVLTWQPKWLSNLYLGVAKASYIYHSDISNPLDALPLQGFFGRTRTQAERTGKKASMGSLFARYVMPGDRAEVYIEYGRKDISLMPWNIIQVEDYRRGYVAGIRKLFPARNGAFIQVATEFTQLQAPTADLIRDPDAWYTNRVVRQGYTNDGRVIGAGIGPGSNSETLEIAWVKGLKKIGVQFERVRYNSDFYYYFIEYLGDFRRHWIDISTTFKADWNFKNLVASAQLGIIRTFNYKWLIIQLDPADYFAPGNEYLNLVGRLNLTYRF